MKENKRFYWLKLKDDFFNTAEIKIMRGLPNGKDYIILLLQLRLLSINHEGLLQYNEYIPYDINTLASLTDTNVDIVRSGIKIFEEMKLLSIFDDGTFFMEKISELVGCESKWAEYKRDQRKLEKQDVLALNDGKKNKLDNVQKKSNENIRQCPIRDKSKENKIIDINSSCSNDKFIQIKLMFNKYLKNTTTTLISECYKEFNHMEIKVIEIAFIKSSQKDGSWLYAKSILNQWLKNGILTVEDVDKERAEFDKNKDKLKTTNRFHSREYENINLETLYDNF